VCSALRQERARDADNPSSTRKYFLERLDQQPALRIGPDGDAQVLIDARQGKVADDDAPFAQLLLQRSGVVFGCRAKMKLAAEGMTSKPSCVMAAVSIAAADDGLAGAVRNVAVGHGGGGAGDGHAVERVGIEAVLDAGERLDQVRVADGEADAQAGEGARFGERLHHQQVRVARHQGDGAVAAEVDVGLVDDDHRVGMLVQQGFNALQRQQAAGGRVRVGEDDAAIRAPVVLGANLEGVTQGDGFVGDAVQAAIDRIKAVGDVREEDRAVVLQQGQKDMRQDFVRAVADEDLWRADAVVVGDGLFQALGIRVGIELEVVRDFGLNGGERLRRRTVGIFVGIQLGQVGDFRLFTRDIGGQVWTTSLQ
jgi:hypothetical protein